MVALAVSHLLQAALHTRDVVLGLVNVVECLQLDASFGKIAQRQVGGIVYLVVNGLQNICVNWCIVGVSKDKPIVLAALIPIL